jgi:hypothetical protein
VYLVQELWNRHDHRVLHNRTAHRYYITHFDSLRSVPDWKSLLYLEIIDDPFLPFQFWILQRKHLSHRMLRRDGRGVQRLLTSIFMELVPKISSQQAPFVLSMK